LAQRRRCAAVFLAVVGTCRLSTAFALLALCTLPPALQRLRSLAGVASGLRRAQLNTIVGSSCMPCHAALNRTRIDELSSGVQGQRGLAAPPPRRGPLLAGASDTSDFMQSSWMLNSGGAGDMVGGLRPDEHIGTGFGSHQLDTNDMLDSYASAGQPRGGARPSVSICSVRRCSLRCPVCTALLALSLCSSCI
jgi:hypothetical protein